MSCMVQDAGKCQSMQSIVITYYIYSDKMTNLIHIFYLVATFSSMRTTWMKFGSFFLKKRKKNTVYSRSINGQNLVTKNIYRCSRVYISTTCTALYKLYFLLDKSSKCRLYSTDLSSDRASQRDCYVSDLCTSFIENH